MSATEFPPPPPAPPDGEPVAETCPRCGAPLRPDQDWCLNCGAAVTTRVAGAPAWRAPIAIVGAVLAAAAVALMIAFVQLSDDSEQVANAPAQTPAATATAPAIATPAPTATVAPGTTPIPGASETLTPTPTPTLPPGETPTPIPGITPTPSPGSATTPVPSGGGGQFATWPAGKTAYTVILWSASTREEALTKAQAFEDAGSEVGILNSSNFSSLRPGYWVVFNGEYDELQPAQDAAAAAQSSAPGAYAKQVKPK